LLFIFTITEALFVSYITASYKPDIVLIALTITAAMVLGLTIYSLTTEEDFTICWGFLFTFTLILLTAIFLNIFIRNRFLEILIASASLLLYSIYFIYDT